MKFEEVLARSAEISNGVYVDAMLSMYDGSKHAFSAGFEKRIAKLKHRAEHPYVRRVLRSVASIVLAILVTSAVWLTVDTQARAAFIGWIKEYYETLFVYRFTGETEEVQAPKNYHLTWIPEGYSEVNTIESAETIIVLYTNSDGDFLTFQYQTCLDVVAWHVDVANTIRQEIDVNGCPADLFISASEGNGSTLMWTNKDDLAFCITGDMTEEELLKMAESIEELSAEGDAVIEEEAQVPKDYHLTWLPDGCTELMKTDTGGTISTVYLDAQGKYLKFHYIYQPDETVWYFDVSHTTRQDAEVYGYPADLFIANSAEHASALMWTDKDDTAFCISGYLTPEELFKLADSIEEIDREE